MVALIINEVVEQVCTQEEYEALRKTRVYETVSLADNSPVQVGWTYADGVFYDPADPKTADTVRALRDTLLDDCDWTQMGDCPLSDTVKASWVTYRQALRDVPEQAGFPSDVTWPARPE